MLWMVKRVFFGPSGELVSDQAHPLRDLSAREITLMVPLVLMVFWMGIRPGHFLDWTKASIDHLLSHRDNYQLVIHDVASVKTANLEGR